MDKYETKLRGKRVLLVSTAENMSAGASWSLLGLAGQMKKAGIDVVIGLRSQGSLYDMCREKGFETVVFKHYVMGQWIDKVGGGLRENPLKRAGKALSNELTGLRMRRWLKANGIDLVHINALTNGLYASAALASGLPVVWHMREFMEEDIGQCFCRPEKAYGLIGRADRLIAVSKGVAEKFRPLIGKDIAAVYNGIDVERFHVERDILSGPTVRICISGRVARGKGQDQLVAAAVKLAKRGHKDIKIQIIGDVRNEEFLSELKKEIADAHAGKMFEFTGFTSEIEKYYHENDIVCVCSHREAFGRVTVEAMAAGALVIGADTGGTKEIIKDGETGILYNEGDSDDLADKIEAALKDPERARVIAKAGHSDAIERFTVERNALEVMSIYAELLK